MISINPGIILHKNCYTGLHKFSVFSALNGFLLRDAERPRSLVITFAHGVPPLLMVYHHGGPHGGPQMANSNFAFNMSLWLPQTQCRLSDGLSLLLFYGPSLRTLRFMSNAMKSRTKCAR